MKWKPQTEIDEEKLLASLKPTHQEIKDAENEIKLLNLLTELEVI